MRTLRTSVLYLRVLLAAPAVAPSCCCCCCLRLAPLPLPGPGARPPSHHTHRLHYRTHTHFQHHQKVTQEVQAWIEQGGTPHIKGEMQTHRGSKGINSHHGCVPTITASFYLSFTTHHWARKGRRRLFQSIGMKPGNSGAESQRKLYNSISPPIKSQIKRVNASGHQHKR